MTYEGNAIRHNGNIFHGRVNAVGTAVRLPAGWTSAQSATGKDVVTHNLGTGNYTVVATPASAPAVGNAPLVAVISNGLNAFDVWKWNDAGTLANSAWAFTLMLD